MLGSKGSGPSGRSMIAVMLLMYSCVVKIERNDVVENDVVEWVVDDGK